MTDEDEQAKRVREKLMVSNDVLFDELLGKAGKLFRLDESGDPHPAVELAKLSSKKRIEFFLVARQLASMGKLKPSNAATGNEMSAFLGISNDEVQKRASDLKGEGKIDSPARGEFRLVPGRIADVLRDLGSE